MLFVDADIVLHRGVHGGDRQHFLRPVVGWRVDVSRRQSPEPVRMLFFEVCSDLAIVVQASAHCGSVSPKRLAKTASREWLRSARLGSPCCPLNERQSVARS